MNGALDAIANNTLAADEIEPGDTTARSKASGLRLVQAACERWAAARAAPTLLVQTEPSNGLTDVEAARLRRWAHSLTTAPASTSAQSGLRRGARSSGRRTSSA